MNQIQDGTGKSYYAQVNEDNQLEVRATAQSRASYISNKNGNAFILASGFVSLTTTGSFNGILYIKNTSNADLYIGKIRSCGAGASMSNFKVKILKNPTAGTLISDANDAYQESANLGSGAVFGGLAYSASGDGKTVTDGDWLTQYFNHIPGHSIQDYEGGITIPKGKSLAILAQPAIACEVCIEVQCWYED